LASLTDLIEPPAGISVAPDTASLLWKMGTTLRA
jgi:hypothetical protein